MKIHKIRTAAENGDATAQYKLGMCYYYGEKPGKISRSHSIGF